MIFEITDLIPVLPEIFVLTMACLVLVIDLFLSDNNRIISYLLAQATLLGAALLTVSLHSAGAQTTFSNMFISDSMSDVLKVFIYLVGTLFHPLLAGIWLSAIPKPWHQGRRHVGCKVRRFSTPFQGRPCAHARRPNP